MAYILSANIHRRNMTTGQRAMVVAMIHPEGEKGGRGNKTSSNLAETSGFSQRCLQQARFVLRHAPDLADSVIISGSLSLDNAYEQARVRKGRADTYEARFNALKEAAPDLAEMVIEEKLTLEEAEAAQRERADKERQRKQIMVKALHDLARHAYLLNSTYRGW